MFNYKPTKGNKKLSQWLRKCAGKVGHESLISAEYQLEYDNEKNRRIYECPFCGKYHIGKIHKK